MRLTDLHVADTLNIPVDYKGKVCISDEGAITNCTGTGGPRPEEEREL